jgi:hypothetical protein
VNGEAYAIVKKYPAGGSHPTHSYEYGCWGGIAFTFKPVNGDTGISATNVSKLNDNTTVLGTIK